MNHGRRLTNCLIPAMGATAVLLAVIFGSLAPAVAFSGGVGPDLFPPSSVELVQSRRYRPRRHRPRPKDPPGTCTMSQRCNAGFIYLRTQCLNRWSVKRTEKRC